MAIKIRKNQFIAKSGSQNGFTLIELIVSTVIIGIIAGLLVLYIINSIEAFNRVQSRKSLIADATSSMKKFTRESSTTYNILTATTTNIRFTTTLDTNIVIDYEINNDGTLTRKLGAGNKELAARNLDFSNSYFNYYDVNDNVATPIRRIRLSLLFIMNNDSTRFTADISPETLRNI